MFERWVRKSEADRLVREAVIEYDQLAQHREKGLKVLADGWKELYQAARKEADGLRDRLDLPPVIPDIDQSTRTTTDGVDREVARVAREARQTQARRVG